MPRPSPGGVMKAPARQNRRKHRRRPEARSRKRRNTHRTPSLAHFPSATRPTPFGSFQKRPAANSASPLGVARHHPETPPLVAGRRQAIRHQDRKPPKPTGASGIHRGKPEIREKPHPMGIMGSRGMGLIGPWKDNGEKIRKSEKNPSSRKFTETDGRNGFAIPSPIRESKKCFSQFRKNIFSFMTFSCVPLNSKAFPKHRFRQRQKPPSDMGFAKTKKLSPKLIAKTLFSQSITRILSKAVFAQ